MPFAPTRPLRPLRRYDIGVGPGQYGVHKTDSTFALIQAHAKVGWRLIVCDSLMMDRRERQVELSRR